jgi:NACHT domain
MGLVATVAVALLVLPWVIALALARRHHLDTTAVGILAAVSVPLSGLWLTWVTLAKAEGPGTPATSPGIAMVADQLAVAVKEQWIVEAAIRRLNDPYPLPVSWKAADRSLRDAWHSLVELATSGIGWPPPPAAGTWATSPDELAGEGSELISVLRRVPTGRLVVLGEPGSGKTMLMVRLILDMLAHRASGAPVPFLASLASWDPETQLLRDWLAIRLLTDHPALANPPRDDMTKSTQAEALLARGLVLPVLDGLDEIPEQIRATAISEINDALLPGQQVVVTCRSQQYREAVRPQGGVEMPLPGAAAVELQSLNADTVRDYLCGKDSSPAAKARWEPVLNLLGTTAPVGQALQVPLMVSLARAIYNPRHGERGGTLRDPEELCNPVPADRAAVEAMLFDAFIPAVYRHDSADPWNAQDAESWLRFLACHLEYTIGTPDLAWWQLRHALPRFASPAVGGLRPARSMRLGVGGRFRDRLAGVLWLGALGAVASGIIGGFGAGPAGAVVGMLGGMLVGGLLGGLASIDVPHDLGGATSPEAVLARDRRMALLFLVLGLGGGLAAGFWAGLAFGLGGGWTVGLNAGFVTGYTVWLIIGYGLSMDQTAWPTYMLCKARLALRRQVPWSLMDFLYDAHQRGVLRQAGAVYQFRHLELQHRLANRNADVI